VTDRRQFLAGLAALPLTVASRGPDTSVPLADGIGAVPCPDPTPGTVTNPSGSVGRTPINDLVDAYSQVSGVDWQHQLYSVLTNKPDACAHYRQNQVVANEKWLIIVQIAYRSDRQPAPFATGTYQIGVGVTDPDGTLRTVLRPISRTVPAALRAASGQLPAAPSPTPPSPTHWSRAATTSTFAAAPCRAPSPRRCVCSVPHAPREPAWSNNGDRLGRPA
jgi:hypothetical protein